MRRMFVALIPLILVSCSQNTSEAILGKWIDGQATFEFLEGGKLSVTVQGMRVAEGTWKLLDDGRLSVERGGRRWTYKVTIDGKNLTLAKETGPGSGEVDHYRRP